MKKGIFTGNQLKLIALIVMTLDHIGKQFFPQAELPFAVGRLAYPIFGYFIAEGCFYTKNRLKYFLTVFCVGVLCQAVYFLAEDSLYQGILITFSLSIAVIFSVDYAIRKRSFGAILFSLGMILSVFFICEILPKLLYKTDFRVDYGFWGVVFPVLVYYAPGRISKIWIGLAALTAISVSVGGIQWFSLAAIPLLGLYNGKRGRYNLKYLFYLYYPLHLATIYLAFIIFT